MNFHLSQSAVNLLNSARAVTIDPAALFAELGRRGKDTDVIVTVHPTPDYFSGLLFTLSWVDATGRRQEVRAESFAAVLLEASVLDLELFLRWREEMAYIPPRP